eukprot:Tbor_TRINITY_DN1091_c0_g1::TRINITY_DN1091_c0_g1_i1::g.12359::m.12359
MYPLFTQKEGIDMWNFLFVGCTGIKPYQACVTEPFSLNDNTRMSLFQGDNSANIPLEDGCDKEEITVAGDESETSAQNSLKQNYQRQEQCRRSNFDVDFSSDKSNTPTKLSSKKYFKLPCEKEILLLLHS